MTVYCDTTGENKIPICLYHVVLYLGPSESNNTSMANIYRSNQ